MAKKTHAPAWIGLAFALAIVLVLGGLQLRRTFERISAEQQSRLQTQANVVAENLVRQLEGVSNALSGVRDDLVLLADTSSSQLTPRRLKALADAMPGVVGIVVLNAEGDVRFSDKDELVGKNFGQREYFKTPQRDPDHGKLYVSAPFLTTRGTYSINLSQPLATPDGQFAGIVSANLDPAYFEIVARSVLYAPDMLVGIVHSNGKLFVDARHQQHLLGMDVRAGSGTLASHFASGQAETLSRAYDKATDSERMTVLRTVYPSDLHMDLPLVVSVSRNTHDIETPWRDDAMLYAALFAVVGVASCMTLYLLQQRRRVMVRLTQERLALQTENAQRLEFGLEGAKLGLWDLNLAADTLEVNARELSILGYAEGELPLKPGVWRALIPEDDWGIIDAALKVHAEVDAKSHTVEHRMRHKDGHLIWVLSHATVIERDARHRPRRILGTHMDISERKRNELALLDAAQRLEMAIETGSIGIIDWLIPAGTVIVNPRGYEILGLPATGAGLSSASWLRRRHPEDVARANAYLDPVRRGEVANSQCAYRMRHADGHYVWIHMHARIYERNEHGEPTRIIGTFRDISERKETEARLASASELQRRTGKLASVGGWQLEIPSMQMTWTDEMYLLYDVAPGAPLSHEASLQLYAVESREAIKSAILDCIADGTPWSIQAALVTTTGRHIWVRTQGEAVVEDGLLVRLVGAIQDITERVRFAADLQHANDQLERLTVTDGLTEVGNRRLFDQTFQAEWSRCARQARPLALLMVDIDHFKAYNDHHGHQDGDKVLIQVAQLLKACVQRAGELVARYGGEEFVVLLPGSDLAQAAAVAQACLAELERAHIPHGASSVSPWLTVSIGVASTVPTATGSSTALLKAADRALYAAKHHGRNRAEEATDALA